jgi:hypothetical protein
MRGLENWSRLLDIVVLDCVAPDKHLLLDGVVTTAYMNTCLRETRPIPRYGAKMVEDRSPTRTRHRSDQFLALHIGPLNYFFVKHGE